MIYLKIIIHAIRILTRLRESDVHANRFKHKHVMIIVSDTITKTLTLSCILCHPQKLHSAIDYNSDIYP